MLLRLRRLSNSDDFEGKIILARITLWIFMPYNPLLGGHYNSTERYGYDVVYCQRGSTWIISPLNRGR